MSETQTSWPVLCVAERRVLGVLVEKAKTTPDAYPMSLNGLVAGSNQKSNREPVLDLSETEVEDALVGVQQKGLTTRISGGRVENLYEVFHVNKGELAVLAELLLRGPQTEGELRGRASRMEPIADLDTLRSVLRPLAERGLIVFLGPEGRRGTMLTHGFHSPQELATVPREETAESLKPARSANPPELANPESLANLQTEIATLRGEVADLRNQVQRLQEGVSTLAAQRAST